MRLLAIFLSTILVGCSSHLVEQATDSLTPGIFLEPQSRDVLPLGVELRPVYPKGLEVTKISEGFRSRLYNDVANYCSIAYGHLVKLGPCDGSEPIEFRRGLSELEASDLLKRDMIGAQRTVQSVVHITLTDSQYAALCDFVYNVGPSNFKKSTLLKVVNEKRFANVPLEMRRWILAGGKEIYGLKNRREREIKLFFDGEPTPRTVAPLDIDLSPIDIRVGQ